MNNKKRKALIKKNRAEKQRKKAKAMNKSYERKSWKKWKGWKTETHAAKTEVWRNGKWVRID